MIDWGAFVPSFLDWGHYESRTKSLTFSHDPLSPHEQQDDDHLVSFMGWSKQKTLWTLSKLEYKHIEDIKSIKLG